MGPWRTGSPLSTGDIHVTDVRAGLLAHLMHVARSLGVASRVVPHLQQDAGRFARRVSLPARR